MVDYFKLLSSVGIVFVGEIFCMENTGPCWEDIINKTKSGYFMPSANEYSEDAENAFGGAEVTINWENIKLAAEKGNSLAQYVYSRHLFALSRKLYNGERRKMRFDAYMYMLIAAVKGDFEQAVESFNYAVDFTEKIPNFNNDENGNKAALEWILGEAGVLSRG